MMERLITFKHCLGTFSDVRDGESDEAAIERARRFYQEGIDHDRENLARDGREEFWRSYIEDNTAKRDNLQIETWEQYHARQRDMLMDEPKEITKAHWWEQFEVLPPAGLIMNDRFTEFHISEAYMGTWHSGYMHDNKTGKYWSAMIDSCDPSTLICVRLGICEVCK